MNSIQQMVAEAMSGITGASLDVTTLVVALIGIVVILVSLDFIRGVLMERGRSNDNEREDYDFGEKYERERSKANRKYWKDKSW